MENQSRVGLMKALGLALILCISCLMASFSLWRSLSVLRARSTWSSFLFSSMVKVILECSSSLKYESITVLQHAIKGGHFFLRRTQSSQAKLAPFLSAKILVNFFYRDALTFGCMYSGSLLTWQWKSSVFFSGEYYRTGKRVFCSQFRTTYQPACSASGATCWQRWNLDLSPGRGKPFSTIDQRIAMCMLLSSLLPQTLKPKRQPGLARLDRFWSIFRGLEVSINAQLQMIRSKSSCSKGSSALMTCSLIFWAVHHSQKESLLWYLSKWAFRLSLAMAIILGDRSDARYLLSFPLRSRAQGRSLPVPQATSSILDADYRWRMLASEKKKV